MRVDTMYWALGMPYLTIVYTTVAERRYYIVSDNIEDSFSIDETPDGPDKDANEAKLQTMLKGYQQALEEEWESDEAYREGKLNPVEIREKTKELLTGAVPKAVAVMLHLAQHGKAETTRLKAATYIIDKAVGKEIGALVGDPLEALLANINQPASKDD